MLTALSNNYDMEAHTRGVRSLAALGLDEVAISGGMRGAPPEHVPLGRELVVKHVLPGMRP